MFWYAALVWGAIITGTWSLLDLMSEDDPCNIDPMSCTGGGGSW